jgi:hypothetical protein
VRPYELTEILALPDAGNPSVTRNRDPVDVHPERFFVGAIFQPEVRLRDNPHVVAGSRQEYP